MFAKKHQLYWLPILLLCCWETRFRIQLAPGRTVVTFANFTYWSIVDLKLPPGGVKNYPSKISLENVTASQHQFHK